MINYDTYESRWFTMEKIDGIVFSNMYLSRELNLNHLENLLKKLDKLHSYVESGNDYDTKNVSKKITIR